MKTKILMTSSSVILGLAGMVSLFAPDALLTLLDTPTIKPLSILIQLMGVLYFSFALMNWTAKDSLIGGIYARPISMGNFAHFFAGTLLLIKYQLSNKLDIFILLALVTYAVFAFLFYWLVFRATGLEGKKLS